MKRYKKWEEFERPFASINLFFQNFVLKMHVEKIVRRCCAVGLSSLFQDRGQERTIALDTYVVPEKIQDFLSLLTPADSQLETVWKCLCRKRASVENQRFFGRIFETGRQSFSRHSMRLLVSSDLKIILSAKHFIFLRFYQYQLIFNVLKLIVSLFYN